MAKKARRKSRSSAAKAATAPVEAAKGQPAMTAAAAKRTTVGRKRLRRRLRKLEGQLANAARQERKRLRRLERALWRRQRIEAAIDEIRTATALIERAPAKPAAKSAKSGAAAKPVAKSPDEPAAAKPAAAATVPADAPVPTAKPAAAKRAPARRVARPRGNGAAGGPRPALPADPAPAPPTQS